MFTKTPKLIDIMLSENFIRTWGLWGKAVGVHVLEGGILFEILENGKYDINTEFVCITASCITVCRHRRGTPTK